jgi:hypothetical protein
VRVAGLIQHAVSSNLAKLPTSMAGQLSWNKLTPEGSCLQISFAEKQTSTCCDTTQFLTGQEKFTTVIMAPLMQHGVFVMLQQSAKQGSDVI